jgi:hypothetical protein
LYTDKVKWTFILLFPVVISENFVRHQLCNNWNGDFSNLVNFVNRKKLFIQKIAGAEKANAVQKGDYLK